MDQPTALVLTAVCTAVPATYACWLQGGRARQRQVDIKAAVDDTHRRLVTLNGMTLGELADAIEARRVELIAEGRAEPIDLATLPERTVAFVPERRQRDVPVAVDRRRKPKGG